MLGLVQWNEIDDQTWGAGLPVADVVVGRSIGLDVVGNGGGFGRPGGDWVVAQDVVI